MGELHPHKKQPFNLQHALFFLLFNDYYYFFFFQKINLFVYPQWRQFVCMNCQIVLGAKSFPFSEGTANKNSHKVVSLVKMSETESTKCTLYPCHATPPSNFQPIRLLDPGCKHKFIYLMLQKPTDLDLHGFHRQGITWLHRTSLVSWDCRWYFSCYRRILTFRTELLTDRWKDRR